MAPLAVPFMPARGASASYAALAIERQKVRMTMAIWFNDQRDLSFLNALGKGSLGEVLGIEFVEIGEDFIKARMPVNATTRQPFGRLHGGASVALAESAASCGGALTIDPAQHVIVGMEINANHIRPVSDGYVFAVARPEALGRSTQVWTIRITDESDRLVCISRMTMAVISHERMTVS
jgi:1,4-dihydroxy-2-naphthoyl-CoA hydrolase